MKEPRDTADFFRAIQTARLTLLFHLVRLLMRDRAMSADQTAADIMEYAEEIKQYFEAATPPSENRTAVQAHLTTAVDQFFNTLASDVSALRGNEGK